MRSVIANADKRGVREIVAQQFEVAQQIMNHGLVPIIEPEVSIKSETKAEAEAMLKEQLLHYLDGLGEGRVMLKLTLPEQADLYEELTKHERVERVVALSGGYKLDVACDKLSENHGIIASFSRALIDGLRRDMSEEEFDATLSTAIGRIYRASAEKDAITSSL